MTLEQIQYERNFEKNTLVWLDENLADEENTKTIILKLRQIINYVRVFANADECVDYISTNENEQFFFLVSSSSSNIIIPLTYKIMQIKFIYIFATNKQYYNQWCQTFKKIGGIFTDILELCDALRRDVLTNKITASSVCDPSALSVSALPSLASDRSNQQEAAFMYFKLLAEFLVELKDKQSTKNEFISICRSQYHGNSYELEKIEEFSNTYSKEHAIRWYTRDSFLYRILNNALRIQDIDILFKLAFFLSDMYDQLESLYLEQSKSMTLPSVVYRGQFMTTDEFNKKIKENIGGFLSINSFFSTSADKQVALMFTGNSSSNEQNIQSVLFEIIISTQKCRRPIANIKDMSYMVDENEILFAMGAVFRIESIDRLNLEDIWLVRLVMNGEEDEELNALANTFKQSMRDQSALISLSTLLSQMGDPYKAEEFILMLIKNTQPHDSFTLAQCYSNLSAIYNKQMKYDTALSCAEKALHLAPSHLGLLMSVYTNLGLSYANIGNTEQAFYYLHKIVDYCEGNLSSNRSELSTTYEVLGSLYRERQDMSRARDYFFKVINIHENLGSVNHPELSLAYGHIAETYAAQNDYDSALLYYFKCLKIQQRTLPETHPDLAYVYGSIGLIYSKRSNDNEAYNFLRKALEIIGSSKNDPALPIIMRTLGKLRHKQNNVTEALNLFHDALDIQLRLATPNHIITSNIYTHLGMLYAAQEDWGKVIEYTQRKIAITYNDPDLVGCYNTISYAYSLIDDYESSNHYNELALDVGRKTLPSGHLSIQQAEEHQRFLTLMLEQRM